MATIVEIVNPSFETGTMSGWSVTPSSGTGAAVVSGDTDFGTYRLNFAGSSPGNIDLYQTDGVPVWEGVTINASCIYFQGSASSGHNTGQVALFWYDSDDNKIGESLGNVIKSSDGNKTSSVSGTAPANTAFVRIGGRSNKIRDNTVGFDNFIWDLAATAAVTLTFPSSGSVYAVGDSVPFRVTVDTEVPIESIEYIVTDTITSTETSVGTSTTSPYNVNYSSLPSGNYSAVAKLTTTGGYEFTSNANLFTIGAPPAPTTREYKASNSYTYLVGGNFANIASAMPSTARVVGVKAVIDYNIKALIRSLDKNIPDPTVARYSAAFDMVPSVTFEMVMLEGEGGEFTSMGTSITGVGDIERSEYLVEEDGTSDDKRWTVLQGDPQNIEIGADDSFFGMDVMAASDFLIKSVGLRAYPNLAAKPSYTDSGDACFRINIDRFRLQVYFDPGSVEYYLVSPDQTKILKGELVHYCVDDGSFRTGDAAGTMQFKYDLEVKDGTQLYVGPDWTIHSEYPPTDANKIADVVPVSIEPLNDTDPEMVGMEYNSLPTQAEIVDANTRYEIITHNFYGDKDWDAMYGVNGVDKAFSYNGDWFYKICTQPDVEKDKPRHISHHHQHLALGFGEGRVDISVVGEPYNYSGLLGASSWAIGDKVVGLLPLSGTILGVFGSKSVWGISGTTVDNFATQILVPSIGAIEYTIVDMGYPVYANAYGLYTLSQTQQYGDYLGTPMSVDVSPWLRPRLIKAENSTVDTVVAWPVRHKNQYRLTFRDGYTLTMTLNAGTNQAPTFSLQKYDLKECGVITLLPGDTELYSVEYCFPDVNTTFYMVLSDDTTWYRRLSYADGSYAVDSENGAALDNGAYHVDFYTANSEAGWIGYLGCATLYVGDGPTDADKQWFVPAAISSQFDNTGKERIHAAPYHTVEREAPSPPTDNIVIWGYAPSASGIVVDGAQTFNTEVANSSDITILGYYTPELLDGDPGYEYPPPLDPQPIDLSPYTYHELGEPIVLLLGESTPSGDSAPDPLYLYVSNPDIADRMPLGTYVVNVHVPDESSGVDMLGSFSNGEGF